MQSVRLSLWTIVVILVILMIITISSLMLFLHNAQNTLAQISITKIEQENRELLERLAKLNSLLKDTHDKFNSYITQDNRQRTFWQIAYIHPDVWSMGIGGNKYAPPVKNLSNHTARILNEIYESVEIIQGRCNLRNRSLNEIQNQIENKLYLWAHIPSINPVPGRPIGSAFGYRVDPITKEIRMHEGVDIGAPTGTPIQASADGVVAYTGWNMGYGLTVDVDHGYGFLTRYAHCHTLLVKPGDLVKRGQVIALVGATGRVTCSHCHYEVHVSGVKVNPANYVDFTSFVVD